MSVYAVADLHLSLNTPDKGMQVFGPHWQGHWDKIRESWLKNVGGGDVVLVPGDISWAINYDEAEPDLKAICELPGHKILMRGNHDFWHASVAKTEARLFNNTYFLQNNAFEIGGYVFAGARGWKQDGKLTAEDEKILLREQERLKLSLAAAARKSGTLIGLMHYPPFLAGGGGTEFTRMFAEAGADTVVFGHIHGDSAVFNMYRGKCVDGVRYELVSCDGIDFGVKKIV